MSDADGELLMADGGGGPSEVGFALHGPREEGRMEKLADGRSQTSVGRGLRSDIGGQRSEIRPMEVCSALHEPRDEGRASRAPAEPEGSGVRDQQSEIGGQA